MPNFTGDPWQQLEPNFLGAAPRLILADISSADHTFDPPVRGIEVELVNSANAGTLRIVCLKDNGEPDEDANAITLNVRYDRAYNVFVSKVIMSGSANVRVYGYR